MIGAKSESQLQDNLSILDFTLPEEVMDNLDEVSATELGFPYDFLNGVKAVIYDGTFELIEDHRMF